MDANRLSSISKVDSLKKMGAFWDTHDFTDFDNPDAPDVEFTVTCAVPKERFLVEDSDISLASLIGKKPELELRDVEILILPSSEEKNAFYSGTLEILDYLHENSDSTKVEIFSTDDEYRELGLHSADFWIGTFWVSSVVVPLLVNLISNYIYDKLKAKDDDHVSLKVIVEGKKGKSKAISFDGNVENLNKALDAVSELSDDY